MSQPVIAVYPGTFDPITLGHEDIVRRAARLFERVVIAVATAHHKKTLFTLDERLAITREALADLPQVSVVPFTFTRNEMMEEMANMISASRAYDANVQEADAAKQMLTRTLTLGQR